MNKENKRFVLSDGSTINSKGFRIDINGLDISRFATNPIMLYEHNPEKVIGRWLDVKKESQKLTAIPEFDIEDTEALHVSGKVERGFLKGASIGIIVRDMDVLNGVDVVTQSELFEASIVSVPADSGAVRLYNEELECISIDKLKLSINNQKQQKMNDTILLTPTIRQSLGLSTNPTIKEIELAILEKDDKIDKLGKEIKTLKEAEIDTYLLQAVKDGKIELKEVEAQREFALLNFERVKEIIDAKPSKPSLSLADMVKGTRLNNDKGEIRDLDWYRKNDPKTLQANPELYQSLLREYKNKE